MEKLFNVIPECFIDTNLIEFLLNAKVNHQHSCNNVIKALNDKKDEFAIGIIDNDKRKVAYINDCKEIIKTKHLTLFSPFHLQYFPDGKNTLGTCGRKHLVQIQMQTLMCCKYSTN